MGMPGSMGDMSNTGIAAYLLNHTGTERFIVAVPSAMVGSTLILSTGKAVMAIGGFGGSDPILTVDKLEHMVSTGEVRYYLTMDMPDFIGLMRSDNTSDAGASPGGGMPPLGAQSGDLHGNISGMPGMGQSEITEWVEAHGTEVPSDEWSDGDSASDGIGFARQESMFKLYDLRG
jgi:4-amino-4-deoxy-L-arabinose transferase-like glycosyltransferase